MNNNIKGHWYCFTYIGTDLKTNTHGAYASAYSSYTKNFVTLRMINNNKQHAGLKNDAVLLSVSYLGYMTKEEFDGSDLGKIK